ncbi:hypothetical protein [Dictyobacter arantiisoli]|uniref:Uncharacterized protein n=1 Tax=Dictyobacter arantiisoli TaxID=2014874 RepID=A0A5A5TAA3_9CHLR|nr:hypothetical protein [Dictyobacter arantiisoli]GCF08086.1 hypothetical protein KDI_16500 [Dictyobacter arantiisoli]
MANYCNCCNEECNETFPVPDLDDPHMELNIYVCVECADLILEEQPDVLLATTVSQLIQLVA